MLPFFIFPLVPCLFWLQVYVIDCGKSKEKTFDAYTGCSSLASVWTSQASSRQRAGRAGRVRPGICYHLFSRKRHGAMNEFAVPEMLRTPLDELCLQIKLLQVNTAIAAASGDEDAAVFDGSSAAAPSTAGTPVDSVQRFLQQAVQPPPAHSIRSALHLLRAIGAFLPRPLPPHASPATTAQEDDLTPLGFRLAQLPVSPRFGKMLLLAVLFRCLDPVLTIAAAVSYRPPWVLPMHPGERKRSEEARLRLARGSRSDHFALLHAYNGFHAARKAGGGAPGNAREFAFCRDSYLSPATLNMVTAMREQLLRELVASGALHRLSTGTTAAAAAAVGGDSAAAGGAGAGADGDGDGLGALLASPASPMVTAAGPARGGKGGAGGSGGSLKRNTSSVTERESSALLAKASVNASNAALVMSVLAAGLYPNVARANPPSGGGRGAAAGEDDDGDGGDDFGDDGRRDGERSRNAFATGANAKSAAELASRPGLQSKGNRSTGLHPSSVASVAVAGPGGAADAAAAGAGAGGRIKRARPIDLTGQSLLHTEWLAFDEMAMKGSFGTVALRGVSVVPPLALLFLCGRRPDFVLALAHAAHRAGAAAAGGSGPSGGLGPAGESLEEADDEGAAEDSEDSEEGAGEADEDSDSTTTSGSEKADGDDEKDDAEDEEEAADGGAAVAGAPAVAARTPSAKPVLRSASAASAASAVSTGSAAAAATPGASSAGAGVGAPHVHKPHLHKQHHMSRFETALARAAVALAQERRSASGSGGGSSSAAAPGSLSADGLLRVLAPLREAWASAGAAPSALEEDEDDDDGRAGSGSSAAAKAVQGVPAELNVDDWVCFAAPALHALALEVARNRIALAFHRLVVIPESSTPLAVLPAGAAASFEAAAAADAAAAAGVRSSEAAMQAFPRNATELEVQLTDDEAVTQLVAAVITQEATGSVAALATPVMHSVHGAAALASSGVSLTGAPSGVSSRSASSPAGWAGAAAGAGTGAGGKRPYSALGPRPAQAAIARSASDGSAALYGGSPRTPGFAPSSTGVARTTSGPGKAFVAAAGGAASPAPAPGPGPGAPFGAPTRILAAPGRPAAAAAPAPPGAAAGSGAGSPAVGSPAPAVGARLQPPQLPGQRPRPQLLRPSALTGSGSPQ